MYTCDLRDGQKMSKEGTVLQKEVILPALNFRKEEYDEFGIIESVNRNSNINQFSGKAKAYNAEAINLINQFINCYMFD